MRSIDRRLRDISGEFTRSNETTESKDSIFNSCNIPNSDTLLERGLISDVEYNLEDTVRSLADIKINLGNLYNRIFDTQVTDGDCENDMSKPNPVYSPNLRIRDGFKRVDNLIISINEIIGSLNKSL